jgi:hypothetical protein
LVVELEGPPVRQATTMASAIIDDMDDEDEHDVGFLPYTDEEGTFVHDEGRCSRRSRASPRMLIAVGFLRWRPKLAEIRWP